MIITFIKTFRPFLGFVLASLALGLWMPLFSQDLNDYGFRRSYTEPPVMAGTHELVTPWAGGMNACQFGNIDLNGDGTRDLFVFDRVSGRILTYLNTGTPGQVAYVFAPEYRDDFPPVSFWAVLVDYNCDGKEDIFTYGIGGMRVYKNTSAAAGLSFEVVTDQLLSLIYSSYQNIFLTDVDYPAIADFDGDGDLDILVFWILGTYVHYHRNMSMEKWGHCDSLDFRLETHCWGYFREEETSNAVTLHADCPPFKEPFPGEGASLSRDTEHIGSTFVALDLNGDQLLDLLLGDVDYPTIIGLVNGGTPDSAHIISQDTTFPAYDVPVMLFSFPVMSYLDVNNDQKNDLLVSPFDPNVLIPQSHRSVWHYRNDGTASAPVFHRVSEEFLQDEMIDAGTSSLPVAFDVNQDGLTDIVLGNFGYRDSSYYQSGFLKSLFRSRLLLFENTGTATVPAFTLADTNWAGVAALNVTNACPAFGDLDGDGDTDMLLGNMDGTFFFFENTAGPGNPMQFAAPVANYQGLDAGHASTPQLFDLDGDGLADLVSGNKKGLLTWFRNTGTLQQPVFTWVTDSLGKVDLRDVNVSWEGYSVPCFFREGDTVRLFAGSLRGGLAYYTGIGENLNEAFDLVDQNYLFLKDGGNSAFCTQDFNDDGYRDLVMGITNGGLAYFEGIPPGPAGITDAGSGWDPVFTLYPNPSQGVCLLAVSTTLPIRCVDYRICDISGKMTQSGTVSHFPAALKVPENPGLYTVRLRYSLEGRSFETVKPLKMMVIR